MLRALFLSSAGVFGLGLLLVEAPTLWAQNDLSTVPRASYPAQRTVYRIPDLKKLVNRRLSDSFIYGDFIVRERQSGTVVLQPYQALTIFGNATEPQLVRTMAQQGSLVLGQSRVLVEEATCPIPLEEGYPVIISQEAPLELVRVGVSQAGSIIAQARFRGGGAAAPAGLASSAEGTGDSATGVPHQAIPVAAVVPSANDKFLVRERLRGAQVWRPYNGILEWKGESSSAGNAHGEGTLRVFNKRGQLVAEIRGTMHEGRLVGPVEARYPLSPDRALYRGGFANWSEHGLGEMTYRSGERVFGEWREGEIVQRLEQNAAGNAPASVSGGEAGTEEGNPFRAVPQSVWNAPDAVVQIPTRSVEAGQKLQSTYDRLKGGLSPEGKKRLTQAQRAWLGYEEALLKLVPRKADANTGGVSRAKQVDYALTVQRTHELAALQLARDGVPINAPGRAETEALQEALTRATRELHQSGSYADGAVQTMLNKWSASVTAIDQALGLRADRAQQVRAVIVAMGSRHLLQLLQFCSGTPGADSSAAPEIESAEDPRLTRNREEAATLLKEVGVAWPAAKDDGNGELPAPLPATLAQRVEAHVGAADARQVQGVPVLLIMARDLHRAVAEKELSADAVQAALELSPENDSPLPSWVESFSKGLAARRAKALQWQTEALSCIPKEDDEKARANFTQAAQVYPSAAMRAHVHGLNVLLDVARDRTLRVVDPDWRRPSLPKPELLAQVAPALKSIRELNGPEIAPGLREEIMAGLSAAALLARFSEDCLPSGPGDTTHVIRAWQTLAGKESFEGVREQTLASVKPFKERFASLEQLVSPALGEYGRLCAEAEQYEREAKYLKAAASFRAALALEASQDLREAISRCEARTSGL